MSISKSAPCTFESNESTREVTNSSRQTSTNHADSTFANLHKDLSFFKARPVRHVQKTWQNVTLYWYILYLWESLLEAKMGIDEVDDVDQVA